MDPLNIDKRTTKVIAWVSSIITFVVFFLTAPREFALTVAIVSGFISMFSLILKLVELSDKHEVITKEEFSDGFWLFLLIIFVVAYGLYISYVLVPLWDILQSFTFFKGF